MTDYKAVQARLNALGQNPPLVVDGVYGPASRAAVMAFQRSKGLAVDGVVGPMTLAALGIGSGPIATTASGAPASTLAIPPPNASAETDRWAYEVAKRAAPNMPEAQRQYALAVARGEGFYGKGWGTPPAPGSLVEQQTHALGLTGTEGANSNNWGAVQGVGSAGSFPHLDHHADGTPYKGMFKAYATPEEGFLDVARVLLKPNVQAALSKGSLQQAVFAQHSNGYFELDPNKYLAAVLKNYAQLTANIGWKQILGVAGAAGVGAGIVGLLLGLGYLGYRVFVVRA